MVIVVREAAPQACLSWRGKAVVVIVVAHSLWTVDASRGPALQSVLQAPAIHVVGQTGVFWDPISGTKSTLGRESSQFRPLNYKVEESFPKDVHRFLHSRDNASTGKVLSTWARSFLVSMGSGTGAAPGSTGDLALDHLIMQRMRFQDKVVMILLLVAYAGALAFSAYFTYRQSMNTSPVTYYADPRYYTQVTDGNELEDFLDAFNIPPKDVQLQITGFEPTLNFHESFVDVDVDFGSRYRTAFSFALDLSFWLVPDSRYSAGGGIGSGAGISTEDLERLADFLEHNGNDLASVEIRKEVHWSDWEELATNIKHQIRQGGFTGIIHICCAEDEVMSIYKNKSWANFMHRHATKVACALSIVGWVIYQPYMWFRHRALVVTSHYCVDVAISTYWPLIADKVGPEGFSAH
mmetsp:Transcript_49480/g.143524  ORF Transcript_49480/g.143524 Transcript_49480/m.143524 type:complete len:408 (+) Transcript_49480:108-1331(+)